MTEPQASRAGPAAPDAVGPRRLAVLADVAGCLNRHVELQAMLDETLPLVCGLLEAEAAWVFLHDPDGGFTLAGAHHVPEALRAPGAIPFECGPCRCQRRLLGGELCEPVNMARCERLERVPGQDGGLAFHASVPLGPVEARFGILNLVYRDERPFDDDELALLDLVATTFGAAIGRARLHERVERSERDAALRLAAVAAAAAPLGVFAIDAAGACVWSGPGCGEITGADADQMHGRSWTEIVHDDERGEVVEAWLAARRDGTSFTARFRLAGAEGDRRVELRASPIHEPDGALSGWGGSVEDVTKRIEAEEAEVRFGALVRNSAALVGVIGADGTLTYVGPSVTRVLGYYPEEFVGRQPSEFVHPDDVDRVASVLADVSGSAGRLARAEVRVRKSDGTWCWLDVAAMDLFHEPSVAGIVVNGLDITDRVAASAALGASERRYRELFEGAAEGIAVATVDGRPLAANPAAVRMLGYENLRQLLVEVENMRDLYVDPADRGRIVAAVREHGVVADAEIAIKCHGGQQIWVALNARLLHDAEGNLGLLQTSMLDITERRRAREELESREAWLRALIQHSSDPVLMVSADGVITYATPATETVLGWTPQEVMDQGLALVHPDDLARLDAVFDSVVSRPGVTETVEYRARHADGSWRHLEAALTSLLDNPAVGSVVLNHRDITDRAVYEQDLAHQALHDGLTGLPNRALFLDRLGQALERSESVTALLLDLADFKRVNESLGHESGDAVLVQVARRLRESAADAVAVARLAGAEFALVYEGVSDAESSIGIARSLLDALEAPVVVADHEIKLDANVGVVRVSGEQRGCAECVLRDGEVALYRAKEQGHGGIECFDQTMREQVVERLVLSQQLRHAIAQGELRMLVQPVIELATGAIVGLEALVAWQHPERGLVRAGDFIGLAEETGLIFPLFEWILREAGRTACGLSRSRPDAAPLPIAVNLSPRQLSQEGLADVVATVLAECGVASSLVALEITESALMRDADTAQANLERLHALGMRLMVDDFGTGYSSLTYLRRFPIDTLKIDQSFVAGLGVNRDDTAIVESTIQLARSLGLESIAEGIETEEQARLLLELGCDRGQGYHYARPMPVGDLAEWLERHSAGRDQSRSGV